MTQGMYPPPPLPQNLMAVHTKLVRTAAASIRAMSYYRDQYQSLLEGTPHDSNLERREFSRRTKILDEERKRLAAKPYEDVRPYVTLMSSIVKQYSDSSVAHTRVRALYSAAATKVILRTVIPRLGNARDRVIQDVKAHLQERTSAGALNTLLVLPGRNALTLLAQPGSASDLWSGQSMSVEDYKTAVSELESWTFTQRRVATLTIASPVAPIERERRPYDDSNSSTSNGIERQRRPYQATGTGEFTDSEPIPNTRSHVSAPRLSPSVSSESQPPEPEVVQQQYGLQFTQRSHLPRTRTRVPSVNVRVPPLRAENPLPRPPQLQPDPPSTNGLQISGQTLSPSTGPGPATQADVLHNLFDRLLRPLEVPDDPVNSVSSPQIAEQAPALTQFQPETPRQNLEQVSGQTSRAPPPSTRRDGPGPSSRNNFVEQLLPRAPDDPVNSVLSPQVPQRVADPYIRSTTPNVPPSTIPPSPPRPRSSQAWPAYPPPYHASSQPQVMFVPELLGLERAEDVPTSPSPQRPPSEPTLNMFTAQPRRPSQPRPASPADPPSYFPSSQPQPAFVPAQLDSEREANAGVHDASSLDPDADLVAMFEDNPLSLIHTRDPDNPVSFAFASDCTMRWLVDALDIEILAPTYLPTGSATVIIDYTSAAMGALLQSSDIVDGDIMMSCYRFSSDPMGWFRESQAAEFVQPEWGREWERYWVWGILYREGDVKVRVKRRVDVEEVRAWLGGSRVWTEG